MNWELFNVTFRILITLGLGFVSYILFFISKHNNFSSTISRSFYFFSVILQTVGLYVVLVEFGSGGDIQTANLIVSSVMFLQQLIHIYKYKSNDSMFVCLVFGSFFLSVLLDVLYLDYKYIQFLLGVILIYITSRLSASDYKILCSFWYVIGAIILFIGSFSVVKSVGLDILYVAIPSFMIYLSVFLNSSILLYVSSAALMIFIGYYTSTYFAQSVSWPIILIAIGSCFLD